MDPYAGRPKHRALFYGDRDDLVSHLVPFIDEGIGTGDAIIAAVAPDNVGVLRESLGETPPTFRLVDRDAWYAGGPSTLGRWITFIRGQLANGCPGVRVIGEVLWPSDPALHWEMTRFEAAANLVWDGVPALLVCPYNVTKLPDSVIANAVATHPYLLGSAPGINGGYVDPSQLVPAQSPRQLEPPAMREEASFAPPDVVGVEAFVRRSARSMGLGAPATQRMACAVAEVAMNAFQHAGSPVRVAVWSDGDGIACQIDDEGAGIGEHGVGYLPPEAVGDRRGLWLARQCVDSLELGRGDAGTAVRLRMGRPDAVRWGRADRHAGV